MFNWIKSLFVETTREPKVGETWYGSYEPENPFRETSEQAEILEVIDGYVKYKRISTRTIPSPIKTPKSKFSSIYSCVISSFLCQYYPPEKIASLSKKPLDKPDTTQ